MAVVSHRFLHLATSVPLRDTDPVKTPKRPRDTNQTAKMIVGLSTGEVRQEDPNAGKNASAVKRGRRGGQQVGAVWAKKLTSEQRRESAARAHDRDGVSAIRLRAWLPRFQQGPA